LHQKSARFSRFAARGLVGIVRRRRALAAGRAFFSLDPCCISAIHAFTR